MSLFSHFFSSLRLGSTDSDSPAATAPPEVRRLRWGVLLCLLGLVVLGLWQELYLNPVGNKTMAIKVLPWLIALPGVYAHRMYTFRVLSLLLWLYTLGPVLDLSSYFYGLQATFPVLGLLQLGLCLLLFLFCGYYIRARLANKTNTADKTDKTDKANTDQSGLS